jgi:hypothetical protein
MIEKIPTWWENSVRRNRKTAGKNSAMVGNFPQWEKKVFCCMDHLVLRHPSYMRGFTFPFSLSVASFSVDYPYTTVHSTCNISAEVSENKKKAGHKSTRGTVSSL